MDELVTRFPDDADAVWLRANARVDSDGCRAAISDLRRTVELVPDSADAWGLLSTCLIVEAELGEARMAAGRAQALAPREYAWAVNLGHIDLLEGNHAAARIWYRRAIPLIEDEETLNRRPLADFDFFVSQGWQANAFRTERRVLAADWRDWQRVRELNERIVKLEESGRILPALDLARRALAQTRFLLGEGTLADATAMQVLASLLRDAGRYQEAEQLFRASISIYQDSLPPDDPEIASVVDGLGLVLLRLGRYADAETSIREALRIRRAVLPEQDPDIAASLNNLGLVLGAAGRYAESQSVTRDALVILDAALPKDHPTTLVVKANLAEANRARGHYDTALALEKQVLTARRVKLPSSHPDIARTLYALGHLALEKGRYRESERLLREALSILRKALGGQHPETGAALNVLGLTLLLEGRYKEAEPPLREALAISRAAFSEPNLDAVPALLNLGNLLTWTGRYRQAEAMFREALATQRKHLPQGHPEGAQVLDSLAGLLQATGRYTESETLFHEALAIHRSALPSGHPDVAKTLHNLGGLLIEVGRYPEAESLLRESLQIVRAAYPDGHPDVALVLGTLAGLLDTMGHHHEAEPLVREVLAMQRSVLSADHYSIAITLINLSGLLQTTGRYAESEQLSQEALEILRTSLPKDHPATALAFNNLGALLAVTGRYAEAEDLFREALRISRRVHSWPHADIGLYQMNLARMPYNTERKIEAKAELRAALATMDAALPAGHPLIAQATLNLGALFMLEQKYAEAEPLVRKALAMYRAALPADHPDIGRALTGLAYLLVKSGRDGDAEAPLQEAVPIALASGEPGILILMQASLSELYSARGNSGAAIFFGKELVNTLQSLRRSLVQTDKTIQMAFVKSNEEDYRDLADRLIAEGRLPEAQQVLRMLKEAEYFEFIRREAADDPRQSEIPLDGFEGEQKARLDAPGVELARLGAELRGLRRLKTPTPEEQARLAALGERMAQAADAFASALEAVESAFAARAESLAWGREKELDTRIANAGSEWVALLESLEAASGQRVALVQYLAMPDRLHILLTQGEVSRAVAVDIGEHDLNAAIQAFRDEGNGPLLHPDLDPRPQARKLYDLLIAPIAEDLKVGGVDMLMVYLDGTLRSLPLAALYDGERWLAERYGIAVYTAVKDDNLKDGPTPAGWSLAGFGVSAPHEQVGPTRRRFGALPAVPAELEGIVRRSPDDPDGSLPGSIYLDPDFTASALTSVLAQRRYPVVHLATHFALESGDDDSFLVLGDGGALTLRDLRRHRFTGVDLVALSACDTAVSLTAHAGREIEGLGTLVQGRGAKGVIATLWPVADASTGRFMQTFYRLREAKHLTKAEALRQAQLALLSGEVRAEGAGQPCGGARGPVTWGDPEPGPDTASGTIPRGDPLSACRWTHPYFWAPFVLMGNWL